MPPPQRSFEPSLAAAVGVLPDPRSPSLATRESALVAMVSLHLCFLPWAFGAMHVWSQLVSLFLGATGLAMALWPQNGSSGVESPASRLLRFPVFWAGVALFAYVAVQALNPSWRFMSNSQSWWLVPLAHDHRFPSGVAGPFARSNPWRELTIWASPWLLACAAWTGFARRLSYRTLFAILVANGALLALLGLAQQFTGTRSIYWVRAVPRDAAIFATFIYRNHAGAYLNLVVAAATGLASWHYRRLLHRMETPGPAVAFAFSAALIGTAVILSSARMPAVLLVVLALVVAISNGLGTRAVIGRHRRPLVALIAAAACLAGALFVVARSPDVWGRFAELASNPKATLESRTLAREAGYEMLGDRWFYGWGAGGFRYGFPLYAQHYPEIYTLPNGDRMYWEHVHDDLLEFPIELGAVGMAPLIFGFAWAAARLVRCHFWRHPFSFCAVAGVVLAFCHAWVDFVFQNPAVTCTFAVLLVAAIRWAEIESAMERRRLNPGAGSTPAPPRASPA